MKTLQYRDCMIVFTCDGVSHHQLLNSLLISEEPVDVPVNNGGCGSVFWDLV